MRVIPMVFNVQQCLLAATLKKMLRRGGIFAEYGEVPRGTRIAC